MSVEERRARLVARHGLGMQFKDPVEAAIAMVALHSSDPASVFLSTYARVSGFEPAHLEMALYEAKSLVRILGMRRTMWVAPTGFAPSIHWSSTEALVAGQRRRLVEMFETAGVSEDGESWLDAVSKRTLEAIDRLGEATARELSEEVPELTAKIAVYKKDGTPIGEFGASTRVLFQLATEGLIVRGRPVGTWLSSQYRWSTIDNWLGGPLEKTSREAAQDSVLTEWLTSFGPGTEVDIKWWTGWPVTQVRKSLERIGAAKVDLGGTSGFLMQDDLDPVEPSGEGTVALLPSLDPTTMGWKERDWYLGDHGAELFDRNGNAGPTVWVDGRIVGGWAQRRNGEIAYELLEPVDTHTRSAVADSVSGLEEWLDGVNVTARFRSPLDKKLGTD